MSINHTWSILGVKVYPQADGKSDVVFSADWKCTGINENDVQASTSGTQLIQFDPANFKPFHQLTEADVVGWVKDAMTARVVAEIESQVSTLVAEAAAPAVLTPALPWAK